MEGANECRGKSPQGARSRIQQRQSHVLWGDANENTGEVRWYQRCF
jgi:hypothetical protein